MVNNSRVWKVCEACYLAIAREEIRRYENGEAPMSELQTLILYQRYRDKVVLTYPSNKWEEVSDMFDATYAKVVESHKNDSLAYA